MKWTFPENGALTDIWASVVVIDVMKALTSAWSFDKESTDVTVMTGTFEKLTVKGYV